MRQLTIGAKEAIAKLKGKAPERTYLIGCSNGGYQKIYTGKDAIPTERAAAKLIIDKWLPPGAELVWNSPTNRYYPYGWLFNLGLYNRLPILALFPTCPGAKLGPTSQCSQLLPIV